MTQPIGPLAGNSGLSRVVPSRPPEQRPEVRPAARPDQLNVSPMLRDALLALRCLSQSPGSALKGPEGEPLSPEQAVRHLADGVEVLVKIVPPAGPARSASALLMSLEDLKGLPF